MGGRARRARLALRETNSDCLRLARRAAEPPPPAADAVRANLRDYFSSRSRSARCTRWAMADPDGGGRGAARDAVFRQDPVEAFSFICSSNNNIARIGGMLQPRARYGVPLQPRPTARRRRRRDERR